VIARDCFFGITRFDDFHQRLGISRNMLTDHLAHLVARGVLDRVPCQQHLVRYDYRLTDKGRDLWLMLTAMRQWGDRWEADDGPPVVIEHRACDRATTVIPTCSSCGERLDARPGSWSHHAMQLRTVTVARVGGDPTEPGTAQVGALRRVGA
jgi:DNA-binding HxlR family transcriptional regulator